MGSRLWYSLVGVGIALGAGNTGCLGEAGSSETDGSAVDDGSEASADSAAQSVGAQSVGSQSVGSQSVGTTGAATTGSRSASSNTTGGESRATSGSGGATSSDATSTSAGGASADSSSGDSASADGAGGAGGALLDAFCDVAWPTTKGQPFPPECADPLDECDNDSIPAACAQRVAENTCELGESSTTYAPYCVAGEWHCRAGQLPVDECACWLPVPEGFRCTPTGRVPIDSGQ